jgi:hypothetical protein
VGALTGESGREPLFWGFKSYARRTLEVELLPLCRDSVRGTWRKGFFSGDFKRYAKRALEMEQLSLWGSLRGI